ncbi:MAG: gfo/Idh/MocA family oxidoreductase, partial [Chloroflexi bacterium]|nr:gfo/Idh/MocA family oxidoreductase [Chloroflexota bacterium]
AGLLGQVYSFHLTYYRSSNLRRDRPLTWRSVGSGSGVLLDLGTHLIDLVLHLLGPVAVVAARTRTMISERPGADGRPAPVEGEDVVWLQLELADGGVGSVEASKVVPGAGDDLRIEAYGSQGGLIFDTRDLNGLHVSEGPDAPLGGRRIATLSRSHPAPTIPGDEKPSGAVQWYLASTAAFLQSLGAGQAPRPDLAAAARVQEVAEAARRSAAEGGIPVRLGEVA